MLPDERLAWLEESFFEGPWLFLGASMRPLTLASVHVCHMIGVPVLRGEGMLEGLTEEEQTSLMARFVWVHTADVQDVCLNFREGEITRMAIEKTPSLLPTFAEALRKFRLQVAAVSVEPLPRASWSDGDSETAPPGVVHPSYLHDIVYTLTGNRYDPAAERAIMWELPFVKMLGYYHCELQRRRFWTLSKGAEPEKQADTLPKVSAALAGLSSPTADDLEGV
jgi:hypothetical protein